MCPTLILCGGEAAQSVFQFESGMSQNLTGCASWRLTSRGRPTLSRGEPMHCLPKPTRWRFRPKSQNNQTETLPHSQLTFWNRVAQIACSSQRMSGLTATAPAGRVARYGARSRRSPSPNMPSRRNRSSQIEQQHLVPEHRRVRTAQRARLPTISRMRISVGPKMPCESLKARQRIRGKIALARQQQKCNQHRDRRLPVQQSGAAQPAHQRHRSQECPPCDRHRTHSAAAVACAPAPACRPCCRPASSAPGTRITSSRARRS